jgi:hypothetical protein
MHVTVTAQRPIGLPGLPGFLAWAKRDAPALYSHLMARRPELALAGAAAAAGKHAIAGLGDFSDIFSSIGSTISDAVESGAITDFVKAAAPIATSYFQSQAPQPLSYQQQLAQAQLARARQGLAPLQTGYTSSGYPVALPPGGTFNPGQYLQLPPSATLTVPGTSFQVTPTQIAIGAAALLLLALVALR